MLYFIKNERTQKVHSVAFPLGMLWRNNPILMKVMPWAAMYFSGEKSLDWLKEHLPNHWSLIVANAPKELDSLKISVDFCNSRG